MSKPSETTQIEFIKTLLRKGNQPKDILAAFVAKWRNVSKRTFERRLKTAGKDVQAEQQRIQASAEQEVAKEVEVRKGAIMTAIERQELLTAIAKGEVKIKKPFVISGKIMEYPAEPDHTDRINAMKELSKMGGNYAPAKTEIAINPKPASYKLPDGTEINF